MRLFAWFAKKETPQDGGIWLTSDEVRQHFENLGSSGGGRPENFKEQALRDGDMERFVAVGGSIVDLRPFAWSASTR